MQYTFIKDNIKLPRLGYGCMRFPKLKSGKIDKNKSRQLIIKGYELGITHFDTAYTYEDSEKVLGESITELNLRDKITISTKLPIIYCNKSSDFDKFFKESLARLQSNYVDLLFLHNITRKGRLDDLKNIGIYEWLDKVKREGKVKAIGFSTHSSYKEFVKIVPDYTWDFVMIQYNYLDINWQVGEEGINFAAEKGLPIFVMEPLRGGLLSNNLPQEAINRFHSMDASRSLASWALRYVLNNRKVKMVLSGMNEIEQIEDNCKTVDETIIDSLPPKENALYNDVIKCINDVTEVMCTSCGYCMPCPKGVSIPSCMYWLNMSKLIGHNQAKVGFRINDANGRIENCIGCRKCEKRCPQHINIANKIKMLKESLKL